MPSYGHLCTEFYDLDKPAAPRDEYEFYLAYARRTGGPILEPMCGSGRFLVPMLAQGFDVTGTDSSRAMLDACRESARRIGIIPVLHEQTLEDLALDRQFALVFIPAGSFGLIIDPAALGVSIRRLYAVMRHGATLVFEIERLMLKSHHGNSWTGNWGGRWIDRPDGAKLMISWLSRYDKDERVVRSIHRYEVFKDGRLLETEMEDFAVRPHDPMELQKTLEAGGFANVRILKVHSDQPAGGEDTELIVECRKP